MNVISLFRCRLVVLIALAISLNDLRAENQGFIGEWNIEINQVTGGKRVQNGLLSIGYINDDYIAHVQGGPIKIIVDGQDIEMAIDDWTGASMPFERYYKGKINEGVIEGSFGPEVPTTKKQKELCKKIPLGCPHPTGTWRAERYKIAPPTSSESKSIDLTGRWGLAGRGMRRWTMDMTDAAKNWNEDFDVELDLPRQRCVSSGLINNFGSAPEIFQDEKKITMIFSSEVRRVYLDDRVPPEFSDWYPLGFSSGRWEGEALVVETSNLMPSVRGFMGNPVSDEARVVERYELDNEGLLHAHMTLYDPKNYHKPPVMSAVWRRIEDNSVVFPLLCDPDSFYRQLYDEGSFQEYIERANRRY